MHIALQLESHPETLHWFIKCYGKKRAYWNLRRLGASRYQVIRAIIFAI